MSVHRYVIVGGTTKAATTSLYFYLADHPEICPSNIKETRFFLDADYPLPAKYQLEDGLDKYEKFFNHCRKQSLRLEVTPDYLYSPGTPQKIKNSLPGVKLIFILREPIDRLISWYRFAKQTARLPAQVSFEQYVYLQLKNEKCSGRVEQHLRALEQGRYSAYLRPYFDLFERNCICVLSYESLKYDPTAFLADICSFGGIDPHFYKNYNFQVFEPTKLMRSARLHKAYIKFRRAIRMRLYDKQRIRAMLRFVRRRFEPFYILLNTRPDEQIVMTDSLKALLEDYYSSEPAALAHLIGSEKFSW